MKKLISLILVLLCAAAVLSAADDAGRPARPGGQGQPFGRPMMGSPMMGMGRNNQLMLPGSYEALLEKLGLTDEQKEKTEAISKEYTEKYKSLIKAFGPDEKKDEAAAEPRKMTREDMEKMKEMSRSLTKLSSDLEAAVNNVLTKEQQAKFAELRENAAIKSMLSGNYGAFLEKLELTDEQKKKADAVSDEYVQKYKALVKSYGPDKKKDESAAEPRKMTREDMEKMREMSQAVMNLSAEQEAAIKNILTKEQQTKLAELQQEQMKKAAERMKMGGRPERPNK